MPGQQLVDIAPELLDLNSKINRLVTNISLKPEQEQPRWAKEARTQLHRLCAQYQSCTCMDSNCTLCSSGRDGRPFRNDLCKSCVVSQLTPKLVYIGPPDERHMKLREMRLAARKQA